MPLKRVLVPVEEPSLARCLLAHIEPLLQEEDAEAVFLRVVPTDPASLGKREEALASARSDLEGLCDSLRADGVHATADWVEGDDPAATILERASEIRASLAVLASHGRKDLVRLARGGTTERLLRSSPIPLLLFNPWSLASLFRRIVVAMDGSESAARILPLVERFAQVYGSEVVLVRVGPPVTRSSANVRDTLAASLEPHRVRLEAAGVRARVRTPQATNVAEAILKTVEEEEADLVAMTTHGRSGLDAWPFGTVAENVFRHCAVPLLVKRVAALGEPQPVLEVVRPASKESARPSEEEQRILVPLDGSEMAERSLRALPTLLQGTSARVILLQVVQGSMDAASLQAEMAAAEEAILPLRDELNRAGYRARVRVVRGDPAERILGAARDEHVDLVLMSTHGRSGVARWVRGSVAERVLRGCTTPLFLLNPTSLDDEAWRSASPFRRILVPLDGSTSSATILHHVQRLAKRHQARVVLFRAGWLESIERHAALEAERALLNRKLEVTRDMLAREGIEVSVQIEFGPPAEKILEAASTVDLIAMTTHGGRGLSRWWSGSVAERVLRSCRLPLLVQRVPPRAT